MNDFWWWLIGFVSGYGSFAVGLYLDYKQKEDAK